MATEARERDTVDGECREALAALLIATEALHEALAFALDASDREPDALRAAFDERERAFEWLRAVHDPDHWRPDTVTRTALARIGELDAEILERGAAEATTLRGESHGLRRSRSAMHAQLARDRDEPRLITVKA